MRRVVEVTDVDCPDGDTNEGNDFGKLFAEFVELLSEGTLLLFHAGHGSADASDGGVETGSNNDTSSFASSDIGSAEDDVLLVLVDRPGVGDRLVVLDHRHGLTGQNGLVNSEGGGVDLDQTEVSGDLVSHGDLHDISGNDLYGADLLDTVLVGADDLAHVGLVLLQGFNGALGVAFLLES